MHDRSVHHKNIQAKLKQADLVISVRLVESGLSQGDALALELDRIDFYKGAGIKLINIKDRMSPMSDEGREKCGASWRGKPGPMRGKTHTEQVKQRLSDLGKASLAKFHQYQALGPAAMAKRVVCLDDGSEFESASAAARHYGVAKSSLIELCLGRKYRKTVGGLRFEYLEGL
jgi:hypothetical protein